MTCKEVNKDLKFIVLFTNKLFNLKEIDFSKEEFKDWIKTTLKLAFLFKKNDKGKKKIDRYFKFD